MSVEILEDKHGKKVMFCNTTMWAFGPVFYKNENAEDFIEWLPKDARTYSENELEHKLHQWRNR